MRVCAQVLHRIRLAKIKALWALFWNGSCTDKNLEAALPWSGFFCNTFLKGYGQMKRFIIATTLLASVSACSMEKVSSSTLNPTSPTSTTTTTSSHGTVATWASQSADLPTGAGCSNFKWNLTTETSTSQSGEFSLLCLGAITVSGTATGTLSGTAVTLTGQGTAVGAGVPAGCTFTLSATGNVVGTTSLPLTYTAQTCLGAISGHETLRRSTPAAPPPPPDPPVEPPAPPVPPTPPPPPPTPVSNDAIDLNNVTVVLGPPNVASWPQTSTVTGTVAIDHYLCINHTKLGNWPAIQFFDDPYTTTEGNQWVIANIGGRWYAGAADWYRPGQSCKDVTADTIGHDAFYNPAWEPLRSWVPRVGEEFGFFATTPARAWPNMTSLNERSNVVIVRWGIQ